MIELELLGLTDGQKLSLNDSEGNRYVLPITDELRAALRTDINQGEDSEPRPITPREIQAHFRAGLSVADVSEISSLPPSQLNGLAYPIFAEREYTAQLARSYRLGHDAGGMTLEELVISRLVSRDVESSSITWDAYRDQGEPWTLVARYESGGRDHSALWRINTKAQTVQAHNDEATWLTENQIPAPTNPWRKLNTPPSPEVPDETDKPRSPAADKMSAIDAQPASSGRPTDIDTMLASLNSKRGTSQPMPDEPEFDGAHPAHSEPDAAVDATILAFPSPSAGTSSQNSAQSSAPSSESAPEPGTDADGEPASSLSSVTSAESAPDDAPLPGQQELPGVVDEADLKTEDDKPKKKRRRGRPAMPSWDEIVFGYSKDN